MYKAENKIGEIEIEYACCKFARIIYKELKRIDKNWKRIKTEINNKQLTVEFYQRDYDYDDVLSAAIFETYIEQIMDVMHKFKAQKIKCDVKVLDWDKFWKKYHEGA